MKTGILSGNETGGNLQHDRYLLISVILGNICHWKQHGAGLGQRTLVNLSDLKQIGIEGIVTALHHIRNGETWPVDEIMKVKNIIESHGMRWSVVEKPSRGRRNQMPVRRPSPGWSKITNNLSATWGNAGSTRYVITLCPSWIGSGTDLHYLLPSGGEVMFFDFPVFIAFDVFILQRPGAEQDYSPGMVEESQKDC
jgi:mannonate dehydratase